MRVRGVPSKNQTCPNGGTGEPCMFIQDFPSQSRLQRLPVGSKEQEVSMKGLEDWNSMAFWEQRKEIRVDQLARSCFPCFFGGLFFFLQLEEIGSISSLLLEPPPREEFRHCSSYQPLQLDWVCLLVHLRWNLRRHDVMKEQFWSLPVDTIQTNFCSTLCQDNMGDWPPSFSCPITWKSTKSFGSFVFPFFSESTFPPFLPLNFPPYRIAGRKERGRVSSNPWMNIMVMSFQNDFDRVTHPCKWFHHFEPKMGRDERVSTVPFTFTPNLPISPSPSSPSNAS